MCRNIKHLYNFDPPATDKEIRGAALQYVRKLTGFNSPSIVNEDAFNKAVDETTAMTKKLFSVLSTTAEPRDREVEAMKAHLRAVERFGEKAN